MYIMKVLGENRKCFAIVNIHLNKHHALILTEYISTIQFHKILLM